MKPIIWTSVAAIVSGAISLFATAPKSSDPVTYHEAYGFIPVCVGVVALTLALLRSRKSSISALFAFGLIFVLFADGAPWKIFNRVFGTSHAIMFRDQAMVLAFLGVAAIAASWFLMIQEKEKTN